MMFRPQRMFAWPLALALLWPAITEAQTGVDLIPEDATFAFVVNGIGTVRDKGEKFITEYDLKFEKDSRPSALIDRVFKEFLGITKGVDEKGTAAVILPSLKKLKKDKIDFEALGLLYFAVPVADVDEIAANFDIKKGELKPGKVRMAGSKALLLKDKHLYVGLSEKALSLLPDSKGVTGELSPQQQTALTKADLAMHFGAEALGEMFRSSVDDLEKNMKRADDADNSQSKQFVDAIRQTRFVVGGLSLDNGGKFTIVASFNKGKDGEAATKFLTALRAGPGASDMIALPAMPPYIGYAAKGDGVSNVAMVRALVNIIFDQNQIETVLPGKERQEIVSSFETMYRELKGSRAALYPTSDVKKFGAMGLVGILDLGDPDKHLSEWTSMVKLLSRAAERGAKGTMRKPPELTYQPKAETIAGNRVDVIAVKFPDLTADEEKFLQERFGADWSRTRLVVKGKKVVFLVGSDLDLLQQTLTNLEKGSRGLADEKIVTQELARLAPERKIEFHFNLRNLRLYVRGDKPEPVRGLTSVALTIETDRLQLEIVAAKSEVKPFAAFLGLADD